MKRDPGARKRPGRWWRWAMVVGLVSAAGCGAGRGPQEPASQVGAAEGEVEAPAPARRFDSMDPAIRPLDAPLETVLPPGEGEALRAVEGPGPEGPTLLFTAALKGYVEPCTCTLDVLLGGIDRISGYVRSLQAKTPAHLMIDAGSMLFEAPELDPDDVPQARLKAELILAGHVAMGTRSTTPGPYDLTLGLEAYQALLAGTGIDVLVANMTGADGSPIGAAERVYEVGGQRIGVVGVADPALFEGQAEVRVQAPGPALAAALPRLEAAGVDARVVVAQGGLAFARSLAEGAPSVDFVLVGHEPREGDAVTMVGDTALLEAYNQGRYLGVLRLYEPDGAAGRFVNARLGSREAIERLDRRIARIDEAINTAPPAPKGEESAFVTQQREKLEALRQERMQMSSAGVEAPPDQPAFAYFTVGMAPGYPHDLSMWQRKQAYNARLERLYTEELTLEVPPPAPGQASYVGGAQCVSCHEDAHELWEETPHSHAWETLVVRNKTFDPECVSCHVTGYGQPGGSIIGQVAGLESVQCEACHGPGSIHVADPGPAGEPGQVWREAPAELCVRCHDPENSPRFDYERYLPLVLGEGHGLEE